MNSFGFRLLVFILVVVGLLVAFQRFALPWLQESGIVKHSGKAVEHSEDQTIIQTLPQSQQQPDFNPQANSENTGAAEAKQKLYRWTDESGKTQFTKDPPADRTYTVIQYEKDSQSAAQPKKRYQVNLPQSQPDLSQSNQSARSSTNTSSATQLPVQCRSRASTLARYERKLDKSDDIVNSIWLQDYCSALSELIQKGCVLPKSEVKYNRYCPHRYR